MDQIIQYLVSLGYPTETAFQYAAQLIGPAAIKHSTPQVEMQVESVRPVPHNPAAQVGKVMGGFGFDQSEQAGIAGDLAYQDSVHPEFVGFLQKKYGMSPEAAQRMAEKLLIPFANHKVSPLATEYADGVRDAGMYPQEDFARAFPNTNRVATQRAVEASRAVKDR